MRLTWFNLMLDEQHSLYVDGRESFVLFIGFALNPRSISLICDENVWVEFVLDECLLHDLGAELLLRDHQRTGDPRCDSVEQAPCAWPMAGHQIRLPCFADLVLPDSSISS